MYMNSEARAEKWSKRYCCIVTDPARGPFLVARKRLEENYRVHNKHLIDVLPHASSVVKLSNYSLTVEEDASNGGVLKLVDSTKQGLATVEIRDKSRENSIKWGVALRTAQNAHKKSQALSSLGTSGTNDKQKAAAATATTEADKENSPVNCKKPSAATATTTTGRPVLGAHTASAALPPRGPIPMMEQRGLTASAKAEHKHVSTLTQAHVQAHQIRAQGPAKEKKSVVFEGQTVTAETETAPSALREDSVAALRAKAERMAVEQGARRREQLLQEREKEARDLRRRISIDRQASTWALFIVLCLLGSFAHFVIQVQVPTFDFRALGAPEQLALGLGQSAEDIPDTPPQTLLGLPAPHVCPPVSVRLLSAEILRFQRAYHGPLAHSDTSSVKTAHGAGGMYAQLGHITAETVGAARYGPTSVVKVVTTAEREEEAAWRQVEARGRALAKVQEQEKVLRAARLARQQAATMEKEVKEAAHKMPKQRAELNAKVVESLYAPFRAIYKGIQNIDMLPVDPAF